MVNNKVTKLGQGALLKCFYDIYNILVVLTIIIRLLIAGLCSAVLNDTWSAVSNPSSYYFFCCPPEKFHFCL